MANPRNYRSSIPIKAIEAVEDHFENGDKKSAYFILDGEKAGFRQWSDSGELEFEFAMKHGVKHGREYCFSQNGHPYEVTPYRNGRIHGTGTQWSHEGKVVIQYKLINGIGLDLWCGNENHTLTEERYCPRDDEVGYLRNWNDDEKTIWQEYYFFNGKGYHGIWREWNGAGRMRRGFPHYYVNNERVTKRLYLQASKTDRTLPPYEPKEDQPQRKLPKEYLAQRRPKRR